MAAWAIVDDIKLLSHNIGEKNLSQDELLNYLIGLDAIYSMKFDDLFSMFEKVLQAQYAEKYESQYE